MKEQYKYIAHVGIELEGAWRNPSGFRPYGDGSVEVEPGEDEAPFTVLGEFSEKIEPHQVASWVHKHYPHGVNDSCGMHVHFSVFRTCDYAKLVSKTFCNYVLMSLENWANKKKLIKDHPFWPRIKGNNRYCSNKFDARNQIWHKDKHGARYTAINYAWGRYKTVECRVLPMFAQPETAVDAIYALLDSVEDYLDKTSLKKLKHEFTYTPELD